MTVDRLFFGSPDLTDDQNNSLFLNVQKFIIWLSQPYSFCYLSAARIKQGIVGYIGLG